MASAFPKQTSPDSTPPIRGTANEPLLEYIRQSAKSIHRTELTVGLLSWLVMGLGTIFAFVLIDHWVLPFNGLLRYAVWSLLVGGSLIWLFFRVAPLIGRSINPEYAAKRIEDSIPDMKDGLISWLQLASNGSTPRGVLNAVGRYVAKHLQGQDVATVIDQFASMKLAAMLLGMTLISAIYLAVSPKSGIATISRLIMPWADIAPSTRVQILSLTPGDATVTEGSHLLVSLQVRGWHRGDLARLRFSTDDGQSVDQTVDMRPEIEGVTYTAELGKSFGGLVQPMHYYVEAGDAKAGPFAIRIQAVPLVLLERVEYVYPTYMRLAPRVTEGDGRIEAPEGTRVAVHARSNQAIKKARIEYDTKPEKDASFQVATVDDVTIEDRSIAASVLLKLDEFKSNPTLLSYRIRSENDRGEENVEPVVYPIKVIPDLAPEVQLASELKDTIDLPVNQKINLEVRATDPDFGLQRLAISGTVNNQHVITKELFRNEPGVLAQVSEIYAFDPVLLRLQPGMQVEMAAVAEDNRRAVGSDQPEPNIRQSRVVRIRIIPPSDVPSDATADKGRSEDSASTNKSNGGESATEKPPKPAPESPPQKKDKNSKANSQEKQGEGSESKPSTNDQNKQSKKSQDDGKAESSPDASDASGTPDAPGKEPKKTNQESNPQPKPPENSDGNASQDSKQGPQGQGVQQDDPSNQEQPDRGPSGAGQTSVGKSGAGEKQPGGSQAAGSESGDEQPPGQGTESGDSGTGGKSQPNQGAGQRGEPMHDGEAFEELQDALSEDAHPGDTEGAGKSTNNRSPDNHQNQSSEPNDSPSGHEVPSNEKGSDAQPNSSERSPESSGQRSSEQPSPSNSRSSEKNSSADEPSAPGASSEGPSQSPQSSGRKPSQEGRPGQGNEQKQGPSEKHGTDSQAGKNGIESPEPTDTQSHNAGDGSGKPSTSAEKGSDTESANADQGKRDEASRGEKGNGKPAQSKGSEAGNPSSDNGEPGTPESGSDSSSPSDSKSQQGEQGKSGQGKPSSQSKGQDGSTSDQASDSGQGSKSSKKAGKATKDSTGNRSGKNRSSDDDPENNRADDAAPANAEQATAELEYARQATDMVLKALERQRDQPDPELLKRMGWSKEQLQAFLERWKNARDQAATNPNKKREYDESLRSLGLIPNTGTPRNEKGLDDRLRGLNEEGSRIRPPESLRERFEAFRKSTMP